MNNLAVGSIVVSIGSHLRMLWTVGLTD